MRIVVLGLSITSSWGNGHATTYRALLAALDRRGHEILFLERDRPWYAANRDLPKPPFAELALYASVDELKQRFATEIRKADLVIVGSYVPDGVAVGEWVVSEARGLTAFYDIDTPVTLEKLARGDEEYLSPPLIGRYDLYLSFTSGPTLDLLERTYHSPMARALYCSVDPERYRPVEREPRWDLGYLGTYSDDRQPTLDSLLLAPARRAPELRFVVAGPQYPDAIAWPANVAREIHLPPTEHPDFYGAQRWTLNVTRAAMIRAGWSPSVRLFEAAACGVPVISDRWPGLDRIFRPHEAAGAVGEIVIARDPVEVLRVLRETPEEIRRKIGSAARARILAEHTADVRAAELETYVRARREAKIRATSRAPSSTRDVTIP
jgi:spore maturation protein CgeB